MKKKNRQAEQCIEDILLENYDRYYRLAYSYTHNEADAEDIVQNGVYKAILYSDSLENLEYAKTWIYRIMLNETFELLKKQRDTSLEDLVLETGKEDRYADIDLQRALNSMSKEDKAVIESGQGSGCCICGKDKGSGGKSGHRGVGRPGILSSVCRI